MGMQISRRALIAGASAAALLPARHLLAAGRGPGGFSADGLKAVTAALQAAVDSKDIGGVVTLLWRRGEVAQADALGLQDPAARVPMARNSIFRIASMTKPVTAVAALMLVEEGRFRLSDPVDRWLPELANRRVLRDPADPLDSAVPSPQPIRVEDLFTHRSGIVTPRTKKGPLRDALTQADDNNASGWDIWLQRIGALPLAYVPGTTYNYGNSIDVLGMLVQRASGMDYIEFLRRRIFQPLGMKDSDFYIPAARRSRAARLQDRGAVPAHWITSDETVPGWVSPAGGIFSTVDDYLTFARMLLGGGAVDGTRLLKEATVADMLTNRLTADQRKGDFVVGGPNGRRVGGPGGYWESTGFGLSLAVKDRAEPPSPVLGIASPGSFCWPGAFGTWWMADPKEQMIQIFMVPGGKSETVRWNFQRAAYAALEA